MKKRILSILLAFVIAVGSVSFSVYADHGDNHITDSRDNAIYRLIKEKAAIIAANGGSAVIELPASVIGNITVAIGTGVDTEFALFNAIIEEIDFTTIVNCLLVDCPYEMFWYDKTAGMSISFSYNYTTTTATVSSIFAIFSVSKCYEGENTSVSTEAAARATAAIATAKAVVDANKDKSDMEKLAAYRDYICNNADYNTTVTADTPYGDPWQIIYVFDGDAKTNVTCEGYVKAFQYLCSITEFEGNVSSYIVSGRLTGGTGEGDHMWNVVVTDDGNYIVDLTNTDKGSVGEDGELFMNAFPSKGDATGYMFFADNSQVLFVYDAETIALYDADIRTLGFRGSVITGISLTPSFVSVKQGETATFTATVVGLGDYSKSVTWSVSGAASDGTFIENGVLTIDEEESSTTLTVTITSVEDPTISVSATVTVTEKDAPDSSDIPDNSEEPTDIMYGDVNGDNKVTPLDASLVLQYNAQLIKELESLEAADVNGDSKITPLDASLILQYNAQLIKDFPRK